MRSHLQITVAVHFAGDVIDISQASVSGTSDESPHVSRKRPRKGSSSTGGLFDLNLPAEVHHRIDS